MKTQPHKIGLVTGVLLGGLHLVWALLVLLGIAQAISDFIFWAHMIHLSFVIGPFDLTATITLIIITTILGYIFGYIGALVWNRFHR